MFAFCLLLAKILAMPPTSLCLAYKLPGKGGLLLCQLAASTRIFPANGASLRFICAGRRLPTNSRSPFLAFYGFFC